jgi:hypothetical protein
MDDDVAPGNRFGSLRPVFPVRNLRRALAHYASLGFKVEPYDDGDGDGYGFAERDEASLHLSLDVGHGPGATTSTSVPATCMSRTPTRSTTSGRGPASAG